MLIDSPATNALRASPPHTVTSRKPRWIGVSRGQITQSVPASDEMHAGPDGVGPDTPRASTLPHSSEYPAIVWGGVDEGWGVGWWAHRDETHREDSKPLAPGGAVNPPAVDGVALETRTPRSFFGEDSSDPAWSGCDAGRTGSMAGANGSRCGCGRVLAEPCGRRECATWANSAGPVAGTDAPFVTH